jgi:hypothetical protein
MSQDEYVDDEFDFEEVFYTDEEIYSNDILTEGCYEIMSEHEEDIDDVGYYGVNQQPTLGELFKHFGYDISKLPYEECKYVPKFTNNIIKYDKRTKEGILVEDIDSKCFRYNISLQSAENLIDFKVDLSSRGDLLVGDLVDKIYNILLEKSFEHQKRLFVSSYFTFMV